MAWGRAIRQFGVMAKRKAGRKVRKKVKAVAKSVGKEVKKPWTTAQVAGGIGGVAVVGEVQRRSHGKKQLKRGRRQGMIVGAHMTKGTRKKVRKAYKQARKAGHRF